MTTKNGLRHRILIITATLFALFAVSFLFMGNAKAEETPSICYKTQIQTYGWEKNYRKNGEKSGTQGQSKRLETIRIKLDNQPYNGDIQYQTHIQRIGWQGYVKNDQESGTVGRGLRLEAIQIRLTGDMAKNYDVYYRVHAQHFGWLDWAKNDQKAGTSTYGYRLEAIQIKLVKKGQPAPGKTTTPYRTQGIQYTTHVQRIGWQPYVSDGAMAGTKGKSLRLEGIRIKVNNELASGNILYRTHVQTYGWEKGWRSNDQMSGTSGQAKRLEAIEIKLTGDMAKKYDVYYRVHAQHFGDLGWAKNGENAGTAGYSYRLEGIRIQLVPKNGPVPGSTTNAFKQPSQATYARRAYQPYVKHVWNEYKQNKWLYGDTPQYGLFDMDGDNIPELIIEDSTYDYATGNYVEIYSYKNNKVELVGNEWMHTFNMYNDNGTLYTVEYLNGGSKEVKKWHMSYGYAENELVNNEHGKKLSMYNVSNLAPLNVVD